MLNVNVIIIVIVNIIIIIIVIIILQLYLIKRNDLIELLVLLINHLVIEHDEEEYLINHSLLDLINEILYDEYQ